MKWWMRKTNNGDNGHIKRPRCLIVSRSQKERGWPSVLYVSVAVTVKPSKWLRDLGLNMAVSALKL